MAPISATYHLTRQASIRMKKPIIIMNRRLAGDGSPSPYTLFIHDISRVLS